MKKYIGCFLFLWAIVLPAHSLPDNIYFKAMQQEMARTMKQLHVKGSARPFYMAYQVLRPQRQIFAAEMGTLYQAMPADDTSLGLKLAVYMYAGDKQNNSSGFVDDYYAYKVLSGQGADSYEALRQDLWQLTDLEYVKAANLADKKAAYKRRKNLQQEPPDFSIAPQAHFVQTLTPFEPAPAPLYEDLVRQLSAQGKEFAYLERYAVTLQFGQTENYFLDSEHNFYQLQKPANEITLLARFRNTDGYVQTLQASYPLPLARAQVPAFVREKAADFLQYITQQHHAKKIEPYVGPVLWKAPAAAGFFQQVFIPHIRNSKSLLSAVKETDTTAGTFKDKLGMRVMSPLWNVFDRPFLRAYEGIPLAGFMPVDAEGVQAQELHLVENGKLKTLPSIRSLMKGQTRSNGHARLSGGQYPRAHVTNVFFEPEQAVSQEELEQALLQRCRELGLEYGYIFHSFPFILAQRIYTVDGHKEPVYGIKIENLTPRSLRDITAAAGPAQATSFGAVSIVTPSILVDEIELVPTEKKPERKPFVPLPHQCSLRGERLRLDLACAAIYGRGGRSR